MLDKRTIIWKILFDFMKELPDGVDIGTLSVKEVFDIIDEFIERHGLNENED